MRTIFVTVYVVDTYRFFHQICIKTDIAAWTEQRHIKFSFNKRTLYIAPTSHVSKYATVNEVK